MKKLYFTVFILVLSLIPIQGAQALDGKRCARINVTKSFNGVKYICTLEGKAKRWRKVVPASLEAVEVKPVEKIPTPSKQLLDQNGWKIPEEALVLDKLTEIAWEKGTYASEYINTISHPKVANTTWAKDANAILPGITKILSGSGAPITTKIDWFVWWDLKTLQPLLPDICWARDARWFKAESVGAGFCMPYTRDSKAAMFIFYEAYQQWYPQAGFLDKYPNIWDEYGITAVASGEAVHYSQYTYGLKYDRLAHLFHPAWIREGASIIYATMAYAKYHNIPYSTARNLALKHFGNYRCGDVLLTDLLMTNQSDSLCEYSGGFLAVEYMIAKSNDILAPYRFLESKIPGNGKYCPELPGLCKEDYLSVVKEIYSSDVDKWHEDMQAYIKKWGGPIG